MTTLLTTTARRRWLEAQLRKARAALRALALRHAAELCRYLGLHTDADPHRWQVYMARCVFLAQRYAAALVALEGR